MWFSGKKFRRIRCENIDKVLAATNPNEDIVQMLKAKAPLVTYTINDGNILHMELEFEGKHLSHVFKLGEEQEMQKKDGSKVKITYRLEGDSILHQVIKMDERTAYFKREFKENGVVMTIKLDGTDLSATIHYALVN
ncbi:fatty acid-binding protein, muscle-like [Danaus plexippus]|uniref:Uncharacterized protein n=1 Tax=Danaus plexippus plexippus TaxID=278856 RepID=A0A212EUW2_DANPL|nr:fatty acid-binding protein, muscle-like [Danaus plexippus]OWR45273.1 hypothetical protein KGM_210805 [Danaus plexippus plexippus]